MKTSKFACIAFTLLLCFFHLSLSAALPDPSTCLVMGQEADPVKGRIYFKTAIEEWFKGQKTEAVDNYEKAIISDHSILKHEDHGMAKALLEKYRDTNASQTPALLCKRGFLENIVIGNLEDSIRLYEKAAEVSSKSGTPSLAKAEANRLKEELKFIQNWQASVIEANARLRKADLKIYLQQQEKKEFQSQVEDNSTDLEELRERLKYLQAQEKEVAEQMYTSVGTAARYRRRYYYPGSYRSTTPDPDANNLPEGEFGNDGGTNPSQVPNPYRGQPNYGASGKTALYRYYTHRGVARRHQEKLAQIRAEISGIYGNIAKLEKSNKELRKKASEDAIK